jgi:hypothetical protein
MHRHIIDMPLTSACFVDSIGTLLAVVVSLSEELLLLEDVV